MQDLAAIIRAIHIKTLFVLHPVYSQFLNLARYGISTYAQTYRCIILAAMSMAQSRFDDDGFKTTPQLVDDF